MYNSRQITTIIVHKYISVLKDYKLYTLFCIYNELSFCIPNSYYKNFSKIAYRLNIHTRINTPIHNFIIFLISRLENDKQNLKFKRQANDAEIQLYIMNCINLLIHETLEPMISRLNIDMNILNTIGQSLFDDVCIQILGRDFVDLTPQPSLPPNVECQLNDNEDFDMIF